MSNQLRRFEGMFRDLSNERRIAKGGEQRKPLRRNPTAESAEDANVSDERQTREVDEASK